MKTAIEMLVEELETKHSDILYQYPILLSNIDKFLETEKQQIIDAYDHGQNMNDGEQYYTSTFETNKETLK